jgi:hypothetical protein
MESLPQLLSEDSRKRCVRIAKRALACHIRWRGLYWAYEVLVASVGRQSALQHKIGWTQGRLTRLTQSLQVHRHPRSHPKLTEAQCFDETRTLIVDYAAAEGHQI